MAGRFGVRVKSSISAKEKRRMCIDYRTLNKITARDNYPLPIYIEEQINALQGKRYFTSFDLKDGFHHVYMNEESIKYTAFITPFGQYEYLRMPFGLKNAPARFQRYVNEILRELIEAGDVVAYMDDFLVATDTIERHLDVLKMVFRSLSENLLQLRLSKVCVQRNRIFRLYRDCGGRVPERNGNCGDKKISDTGTSRVFWVYAPISENLLRVFH